MLHRAMLGSLGLLLERTAGRLPPWLAPEQVRVLAVAPPLADYAAEVAAIVGPRDRDEKTELPLAGAIETLAGACSPPPLG